MQKSILFLQIFLTKTLSLETIVGFENCFGILYDFTKTKEDFSCWNLHSTPLVRLKNAIPIKNEPASNALTTIYAGLFQQRAFECFVFYGIGLESPEIAEKFKKSYIRLRCGQLGPELHTISACHPKETYLLGLYNHKSFTKLPAKLFMQKLLANSEIQFFGIFKIQDSTIQYGLINLCEESWIFTTAYKQVTKRHLDQWYKWHLIDNNLSVELWSPLTEGPASITKYLRSADDMKTIGVTESDKVNLNIFKTLLYRSNTSYFKNMAVCECRCRHISVYTGRSMARYTWVDQNTHKWFVVENFDFELLSCADTGLRKDRYVSVFGIEVWITLGLAIAGIASLISILQNVRYGQCETSKSSKSLHTLDFVLRILLEQGINISKKLLNSFNFKSFFALLSIAITVLLNAYRGKLSMHFCAPPGRNKITSINQGIDQSVFILTEIDSYSEASLRQSLFRYNVTASDSDKNIIIKRVNVFTSRFFRIILEHYNAASNKTKGKYERIIGRFFNITTHPNWTLNTTDVLLHCNKTMLVAQSTVIDEIFVRLQQVNGLIPNLYRARDGTFSSPRVWVLRGSLEWDRGNILGTTFSSILHSGIFGYWVERGKWYNHRKVAELIKQSLVFDYIHDAKYDMLFLALILLHGVATCFFLIEIIQTHILSMLRLIQTFQFS